MFVRLAALLSAMALLFTGTAAYASRVSPMIVDLEPMGRSSITRIELVNDGLRDIPYEVQMMRGVITPQGQLELIPADDQFVVFPAQTLVESNSQQVFRVQYVGEQAIDTSAIYYMSIRQIPVEFTEGVTQIQMVVNYNVLVNVVPDGTRAEPVVNSAGFVVRSMPGAPDPEQPDGDAVAMDVGGIEVDVGNAGNRYFLAGLSKWTITGTGEDGSAFEQSYTGEEMSRIIGVGVVAPQANRIFFIPTSDPLRSDSLRISIEP